MIASTLTHKQHTQRNTMKELAQVIVALPREEYDLKIFSNEEIAEKLTPEIAEGLMLCEGQGAKSGDIIASEIIHRRKELAELTAEDTNFRRSNKKKEEAAELTGLIEELESILKDKIFHAERMKKYTEQEKAFHDAIKLLEPLSKKMKAIEKELKDNYESIRTVEADTHTFGNTLDADSFRAMLRVGRPGGQL